jgi:uncharacterized integral membrane protein
MKHIIYIIIIIIIVQLIIYKMQNNDKVQENLGK